MSDYLVLLYSQRQHAHTHTTEKQPLSSGFTPWLLALMQDTPLAMARLCISCICSAFAFKPSSSSTSPRPWSLCNLLLVRFARCCRSADGGGYPYPHFMGRRLWDLLTLLTQYTPNDILGLHVLLPAALSHVNEPGSRVQVFRTCLTPDLRFSWQRPL